MITGRDGLFERRMYGIVAFHTTPSRRSSCLGFRIKDEVFNAVGRLVGLILCFRLTECFHFFVTF